MKKFENDNWEVKAKLLADAFQPQPDNSVWLNVEAAISDKKRKKFFLILFSVVGFAILIVSGFIFNSYNTINDNSASAPIASFNILSNEKNISEQHNPDNFNLSASDKTVAVKESNGKYSETKHFVITPETKPSVPQLTSKKIAANTLTHSENQTISELITIEKQNEFIEKPDELVEHKIYIMQPMPPSPVQACSYAFRDEPKILSTLPKINSDYFNEKKNKWSVMIASSTMIQQSQLKNTDTIQFVEKLPTHYFDGSIHLIYQHPKWKNLELNFGAGYYEMTQGYSLEKILPPNSTISGTPAALNSPKSYSRGSEFYRSGFVNFQLAVSIFSSNRFRWDISSGIQAEYLLKHSTDNSNVGLLLFGNQFSNAYATEDLYPNMNSELNRIYLKAMVGSSIRYSLSNHFALQSGVDVKYAFSDRYNKSSTLRQRDLNLGLNAGIFYRF